MKLRSRQYSGRPSSSAMASSELLNRDQPFVEEEEVEEDEDREEGPAQTSWVRVRSWEIVNGDSRPRGVILSKKYDSLLPKHSPVRHL